jgi:hypothetical protein
MAKEEQTVPMKIGERTRAASDLAQRPQERRCGCAKGQITLVNVVHKHALDRTEDTVSRMTREL